MTATALYVLQLVVLLVGVTLFAATAIRWRHLDSTRRAGRCAIASVLMAISTVIGAFA